MAKLPKPPQSGDRTCVPDSGSRIRGAGRARITHPVSYVSLVFLVLGSLFLATVPSAQAAYPATVSWANNGSEVNSDTMFYPWDAVDSNNHTHIAYITDGGNLVYVNNVDGGFSSPQTIDKGLSGNKDPYMALRVGPGNVLHLAYTAVGAGNNTYYRRGTLNGSKVTWSNRQLISSGNKSFAANLTVDKDGNAHIVWIESTCSTYSVYYRMVSPNGDLSDTDAPKADCTFENRPQVVVTNDGKVHIIYQHGGEIYYSRRDSSGWSSQNISSTSSTSSQNPTIATDGVSGLFVAWDEGTNGHDIRFRRSKDGGQTWSNWVAFSDSSAFASYPNATWSATAQRAYVVWSDATQDNLEIWDREFDPSNGQTTNADRLTHLDGDSAWPIIAVGPTRADVVWQDKVNGPRNLFHIAGTISGPAGCGGSLSLAGGAASTNTTSVPAVITPQSGCTPDQMQVSVDTPITNSTPKQTYSSSFSANITDTSVCNHTVYVRLFTGGTGGTAFSSSIIVDTSVTATVGASNPYLLSNSPPFTPADTGAQDGDPAYTRNGQAFVRITDAGDCTGLKTATLPNGDQSQTQTITNGSLSTYVTLPGTQTEGSKAFLVTVTDQIGNSATFPSATQPFVITYDKTPPVVNNTNALTVTSPVSATSIIVPLTFTNVSVTDNLYGQREGLAPGKQFWGVWVANSQQPNANPATLQWTPVRVPTPDSTFRINWSLFTGLGFGPNLQSRSGVYYVYVKFLDGAGNPSTTTLQSKAITLPPNYTVPTQYLSLISR